MLLNITISLIILATVNLNKNLNIYYYIVTFLLARILFQSLNRLFIEVTLLKRNYIENFEHKNVEDNIYLFDSFWGRKVGCNPYALFKEITNREPQGKNKYIWVKNKNIIAPLDVQNNPDVIFVEHHSYRFSHYLLVAKYFFINSNLPLFFIKKKDQIIVNTWHGIPIKKLGLDIDNLHFLASQNTQRFLNISDIIPLSSSY